MSDVIQKVLFSEDTNEKLYTVNNASQNNHKLKFVQEPFCVYGYTNRCAHVHIYTYTHTVCMCVCVCITYTTRKQSRNTNSDLKTLSSKCSGIGLELESARVPQVVCLQDQALR